MKLFFIITQNLNIIRGLFGPAKCGRLLRPPGEGGVLEAAQQAVPTRLNPLLVQGQQRREPGRLGSESTSILF